MYGILLGNFEREIPLILWAHEITPPQTCDILQLYPIAMCSSQNFQIGTKNSVSVFTYEQHHAPDTPPRNKGIHAEQHDLCDSYLGRVLVSRQFETLRTMRG